MSCDLRVCKTPTPSQAHCSVCHRTFGGVSGFDAHRRHGECLDPVELGYVERERVWRKPGGDGGWVAARRMAIARHPVEQGRPNGGESIPE